MPDTPSPDAPPPEGSPPETPILYLDADDEITSAAARIRGVHADRVALVLPYGSRLATSRINFRLLAREATERGKAIEIVAADASARALAVAAGLTVHPSVAAFEAAASGESADTDRGPAEPTTGAPIRGAVTVMPSSRAIDRADDPTSVILVPKAGREPVPIVGRTRPPVRPGIAIAVAVVVLAIVAIAGALAFTLLPSATISVSPWSAPIGPVSVDVVADATATSVDPSNLTVPAQTFSVPVSVQQMFQATGVNVTETKATGEVEFANFDTGRGVLIPSGTVVQTDTKVEFTTTADLTLPRASFDFFPPFAVHPSTGTVGVQAVQPGLDGNVGSNTITVIPKARNTLHATNADPTTGGTHAENPAVTQADVDAAMATLNAALQAEVDRQLGALPLPSGVSLYAETKQVGPAKPTIDPATLVGTAVTQFQLGLSATGTELGVDAAPIRALAQDRLAARVDAGWAIDPASVQITVGAGIANGSTIGFPVVMSATETRIVDGPTLETQVEGLDEPAARARLSDYGSVQISLWPDWVTTIPTNPDRITFTIGSPAPRPTPSP